MADWLGTMDAETLLHLAIAAGMCAIILAGLLLMYVVAARRRIRPSSDVQVEPPMAVGAGFDDASLMERVAVAHTSVTVPGEMPATTAPTSGVSLSDQASLRSERELLRLLYDAVDGQIWVRIGAARYRAFSDIQDRSTGQRVLAALTHALRFSGGLVASDQGAMTLALPPCAAVPVPAAPPGDAPSEAPEAGEWLRLLGDAEQGRFWVQIAGQRYARLQEVTDRQVGLCILKGISYLVQFTRGLIATDAGVGSVPLPTLRVEAPPASVSFPASSAGAKVEPSTELIRQQEAFLRRLLEQGSSQPALTSKKAAESGPTFDLVDEINRIFQSKLALSARAGTDAELIGGRDGSVRVRIGSRTYESPDQVPDEELRSLIKAAIAEW